MVPGQRNCSENGLSKTILSDLRRHVSFAGLKKARGGGVLPYMGYMGMCRCDGYGFQAVYSRIGYINQRVWV